MRVFHAGGHEILNGFQLYSVTDAEYRPPTPGSRAPGCAQTAEEAAAGVIGPPEPRVEEAYDRVVSAMVERWEADAGLMTIGEAVLAALRTQEEDGNEVAISAEEWTAFAKTASFWSVREKARELGIDFFWDADVARTPEGFYQVRGGLEYAIRKSLSVAPYADIIWMETASADIHEAQEFAEAIHAEFPDQLLAYNLSPSFNWDSTGMSDDEMRAFPEQLGEAGFVFNFITYGGHQIDGVAAEEFATALLHDGMLALAQVQRRIRLLESPYRTPQTHVGGPRLDAALAASSARTATTKAMGKGSTQVQHLADRAAEEGARGLAGRRGRRSTASTSSSGPPAAQPRGRRPARARAPRRRRREEAPTSCSPRSRTARAGRSSRSATRTRSTTRCARSACMTLVHLYLLQPLQGQRGALRRPDRRQRHQCERMKAWGIYSTVSNEVGAIIVAQVDQAAVAAMTEPDAIANLIRGHEIVGSSSS